MPLRTSGHAPRDRLAPQSFRGRGSSSRVARAGQQPVPDLGRPGRPGPSASRRCRSPGPRRRACPPCRLAGDPRLRIVARHPAPLVSRLQLDAPAYVDDQRPVEPVGLAGLHQQWDVVHDHRVRRRRGLDLGCPGPDPRMDDRLQPLARLRRRRTRRAECRPVQRARPRSARRSRTASTTSAEPVRTRLQRPRGQAHPRRSPRHPARRSRRDTSLFPDPIPPVNPTRSTPRTLPAGVRVAAHAEMPNHGPRARGSPVGPGVLRSRLSPGR